MVGTQDNVERAAEKIDKPGDIIGTKIPSTVYLSGMLGSVVVSLGLWFAGKKDAALFVGLWAPTFLHFGTYNKLLRISRGNAEYGNRGAFAH